MASPAIHSVLYLFLYVARKTPAHLERRYPCDPRHRGDVAMTLGALKPCLYMPFMRIINVIGQVMHLYPRNWLFIVPVLLKLLYLRGIGLDDIMATHAFPDIGHTGVSGTLGVDMAVLTRNLIYSCVDDVAELDRLSRSPAGKIGVTDLPTHNKGCAGN